MTCPVCGAGELDVAFRYTEPPEGETPFDIAAENYAREYRRCPVCGHFVQATHLDLSSIYSGDYVDATYSGDRLQRTYERVMELPFEQSDNTRRVERVVARYGPAGTVLDVGSGLGVFPARMREAGWTPTALDPDPRACEHLRERVSVNTVEGDFLAVDGLGRFDLVSLNKVLEHVADPEVMLARASLFSDRVYVEVPDAEAAVVQGPGREEFFIEHHHVFSMASLCILATHAGFEAELVERLHEPSDKYTLVAFLRAAA